MSSRDGRVALFRRVGSPLDRLADVYFLSLISTVRTQTYASDYAFQYDVVNTLNSGLNDGHTIFESPCCTLSSSLRSLTHDELTFSFRVFIAALTDWGAFQSILPFPIVALAPSANSSLSDVQIRIAPDATTITRNLGARFLATYGIDDFASASSALLGLIAIESRQTSR